MLPRILIVDDESSICISLSLALEPEYEVIWETDPIRALERLQTEPIDLVLLDMVIGPYDGLDILMKIKKLAPLAAVIMMTAYGSIRSSVSAMTRGAFTYLTKPLDLEELKIYIRQALEFRSLNENVTYLNDQLEAQNQAEELIGTSPALEQVRTMLRKFQNVDVNVLITGESGTGKRIAAHTLHNGADGRRFVTVNCAAFDEKRLEEEFFGYKMDAVPGALCDRRGKLDALVIAPCTGNTIAKLANSSFMAAVSSIIVTARLNAASTSAGTNFELDAIAACYIGGCAAGGGEGTIMGVLIGALVMGILNNGMSIMGIGADFQKVVKGAILLLAVTYDVYSKQSKSSG